MKEDEKRFFIACYTYGRIAPNWDVPYVSVRKIINILSGYIHHKRCWYYLEKWSDLGFYDYGVTLDLGWIYPDKLPERYKKLLEE